MTDLASRLETAGPDADLRALSDEVLETLGWTRGIHYMEMLFPPHVSDYECRETGETNYCNAFECWNKTQSHPAASVDDGLTLTVEAGEEWDVILHDAVSRLDLATPGVKLPLEKLPLYICAELVRASEAKGGDQ